MMSGRSCFEVYVYWAFFNVNSRQIVFCLSTVIEVLAYFKDEFVNTLADFLLPDENWYFIGSGFGWCYKT